jgi:hypothetical protein
MCTHCYIPLVTPSPNTSIQGWKCFAYINCHTTKFSSWQCFLYHYHCTYTYPLNSMIKWLLHHLLHVTFITVSNSCHKIKVFFLIIAVGTLLTEQASYINCHWVTMLRNILTPFSVGLWRNVPAKHSWPLNQPWWCHKPSSAEISSAYRLQHKLQV